MIVVNGRFLRARPTGMHRAARALVSGLRGAGQPLEVWAPPGIGGPEVDRVFWGPPGWAGDHVWEQVALPAAAGRRLVLSLVNTAPILAPASAVWVHDLAPLVGPHWFRRRMAAYGRLVLAGARRARVVLVPSNQVAAELAGARVAEARTVVVRTPVDERFRPAAPAAVEALRGRLRLERPYVVHVGWPDPRKDAATAAAAHLEAERRHPHDLVLVGRSHPTFAPVSLPSAPSIRALEYFPDSDLPALLSGAAALLFPSVYEGFGLPPLEALACGTPALVSDLPAMRESSWGLATYLPPGDVSRWAEAIAAVLRAPSPVPPLPAWTTADMASQVLARLSDGRARQ